VPLLRWSGTTLREIESVRDRIMSMCGTSEPLILADDFPDNHVHVTIQWRKPLAVSEINQMAPTPDVLGRKGRP
jgi:hypothetical protein